MASELDKFLDLAGDVIQSDSAGALWIKIEDLKRLEAEHQLSLTVREAAAPKPRNFEQAKAMASKDPEIAEAFADRPPTIRFPNEAVGTPPAIEGVKS